MLKRFSSSRARLPLTGNDAESGVALFEFSIVLPFLLLFIMAIWDLGRALNEYLTVSRIVYEGTRFAASVPGLETPTTVSAGVTKGETDGLINAVVPLDVVTHKRVRDRISQILVRYNIPFSDANVKTQVVKDYSGGGVPNFTVTVGVRLRFRSNFPLLDQLLSQVGSESTGPYMFSN